MWSSFFLLCTHHPSLRSRAAFALATPSCHLGQGIPGCKRVHVPEVKRARRIANHSCPRHWSSLAAQLFWLAGRRRCASHLQMRSAKRRLHRPFVLHVTLTCLRRRRKYVSSFSPAWRGTFARMENIFRCTRSISSASVSW